MSGNRRTPKSTILGRFGILGASIGVTIFYIATAAGLAVTIGPFLIGGLVGIGLLVLFVWGGTNLIALLFMGNDPEYRAWRREGGDPYFDNLPPPFNTDSNTQRDGGLAEPEYEGFVPPDDWVHQCPKCGARWEHAVGVCWNCNYGSDMAQCAGCGEFVKEPNPGDFETCGVICPHCSCVIRLT